MGHMQPRVIAPQVTKSNGWEAGQISECEKYLIYKGRLKCIQLARIYETMHDHTGGDVKHSIFLIYFYVAP